MNNQPHTIQLIGGDGVFNLNFNGFMDDLRKRVNFGGCTYRVVSIIGPQGSGKSTLLNLLFQTSFDEMNTSKGRPKTTNGIWLATCADIDPFTLVMDVEGTDGKEANDDTAFEKQSALFALAVSDIIIINMSCNEIGRQQAANKPLLRTVFQVMMQLFKPRKTMLLFTVRDRRKADLEPLEEQLRTEIKEIGDSVKQDPNGTQLEDFFRMKFVFLPHYEYELEEFKKQVQHLKETFFGPLASVGWDSNRPEVPITGFAHSVERIWKSIKENKDLNLPKHASMVATFRCEEIFQEKLKHLLADKGWCELQSDARLGPVDGFGEKLSGILNSYLLEYDEEVKYFDEAVSSAKRQQMESSALNAAYPAYREVVRHLSCRNLDKFKDDLDQALKRGEGFAVAAQKCLSNWLSEFDKGCKDAYVESLETARWDPSGDKENLKCDIYKHMLAQLAAQYEGQLRDALEKPLGKILDTGDNDTWPKIRKQLGHDTAAKQACLSRDLSDLGIDKETTGKMLESLAAFGISVVRKRAQDEARKVVSHMKDKFLSSFNPARNWAEEVDIKTITQNACSGSLKLLSVMVAIRLDDEPDNMENTISLALTDDGDIRCTSGNSVASSTWEGIPAANVLISPVDCKALWTKLKKEIQPFLEQANAVQMIAAKLSAANAKVAEANKLAAAEAEAVKQARLVSKEKAEEAKAAELARAAAEARAKELERFDAEKTRWTEQVTAKDQELFAAEKALLAAEVKADLAALEAKAKVAAAEAKAADNARLAAEAKAQAAAAEAKAAVLERMAAEREAKKAQKGASLLRSAWKLFTGLWD